MTTGTLKFNVAKNARFTRFLTGRVIELENPGKNLRLEQRKGTNKMGTPEGSFFLVFAIAMYLVPSIVANKRNHPNAASITVINLFLGWTLLGWVVALAWAVSAVKNVPEQASQQLATPANALGFEALRATLEKHPRMEVTNYLLAIAIVVAMIAFWPHH